jgi:[ribosomal protein S5]-alanine N-acetyltransferase
MIDTDRLRLVPVGPEHADDLLRLHRDPGVARWYGAWTAEDARRNAAAMGEGWRVDGVHKWLAYDRADGTLIGRGGLSYKHVDGARRLELGWAVRERFWGMGYASEIGRAGLGLAFGELGAEEVVAFTESHNERSRAVMLRLGFQYARDIHYLGEPFVLYVLTRAAWSTPTRGRGSGR